jgi:hypothetical protein
MITVCMNDTERARSAPPFFCRVSQTAYGIEQATEYPFVSIAFHRFRFGVHDVPHALRKKLVHASPDGTISDLCKQDHDARTPALT